MKKLFTAMVCTFALALGLSPAMADEGLSRANLDILMNSLSDVHSRDLINWKVGDSMDYKVKMGPLGGGTMKKYVREEVKSERAIWIVQDMNVMNQKQTVEMLMRRADGEILKVIQNGQETSIPENDLEVISTNYENVTVPAGTYNSLHVVANTKDVKNLQVWMNGDDTCMDGAIKQVVPTSFVTLTIELTSFTKN